MSDTSNTLPLPNPDAVLVELKHYVHTRFKVSQETLEEDPSFEDMGADSITRLEILLHADETFGSHVLDYLEDGLLEGTPPKHLSELAALVPRCTVPAATLLSQRKLQASKNASTTEHLVKNTTSLPTNDAT
jgi:hypothetical protein